MIITERIEINPDVLAGKPVVKGTRVPAAIILKKLSAGIKWEKIQEELGIEKEDITAVLKYAENLIANEEIFEVK